MRTKEHKVIDESDQYFQTDHLNADLEGRSARSGALTLFSQGIKFVLTTGSTIILARLLSPADYGIVGMVAIVLNFSVLFQYLGLSTATIQWPKLTHRQVSTLFWLNVGLSTGIAVFMALMSPVIAWFFQEPQVIGVALGYAVTVFITGLWIQHEALLNRQMRFGVLTIIDITSLLAGLITAVVSALNGAGYWALVFNQLAVTTVQAVGYWLACGWRPGLPSRGNDVWPMVTFGAHFTGSNLLGFLSRNFDNILIGRFWGATQLGVYTRGYQLLLMPIGLLLNPIANVAMPTLSRLIDTPDRYRKAYLRIIEKIAMVTMPGVAFLCAISDWLIQIVLGPQWSETAVIFMFLGISAAVQPITRTAYWLFATQNRTRDLFIWSFIGTIIAVISICAGLPWGAAGVACSYALADFFIYTPLLFWFVGKKGPVSASDFYRTIFPSICASVFSLAMILVSRDFLSQIEMIWVRLVLVLLIAIITSLLVFALLPGGRKGLENFKDLFILIGKGKRDNLV